MIFTPFLFRDLRILFMGFLANNFKDSLQSFTFRMNFIVKNEGIMIVFLRECDRSFGMEILRI